MFSFELGLICIQDWAFMRLCFVRSESICAETSAPLHSVPTSCNFRDDKHCAETSGDMCMRQIRTTHRLELVLDVAQNPSFSRRSALVSQLHPTSPPGP